MQFDLKKNKRHAQGHSSAPNAIKQQHQQQMLLTYYQLRQHQHQLRCSNRNKNNNWINSICNDAIYEKCELKKSPAIVVWTLKHWANHSHSYLLQQQQQIPSLAQINGQPNRQTDRQMNICMNEWMNGLTNYVCTLYPANKYWLIAAYLTKRHLILTVYLSKR